MNEHETTHAHAAELDAGDELAPFRDRFLVADRDLLYLDGNSLGRLSTAAAGRLSEVVRHEWGESLVGGWNGGWYEAPRRVGDAIGALIGAEAGQTVVADSTSVNLFKALVAALRLRPGRHTVVTDTLNFPSDLYVVQGAIDLLGGGRRLVSIGSLDGDVSPDLDALRASLDGETALLVLSHAAYRSGYLYDIQQLTHAAHSAGALVVWDLSHSVGVVPIELDRWGVDFAVGCSYKYLNGGPGAPSFLYVRRSLIEQARSPVWGWFGQHSPFAFAPAYEPARGIERFLAGTPPILSLLAMEAALDPVREAGVERLRRKSIALTEYFISLADHYLAPLGFTLASPRDARLRGSHVALRHAEGYRIARALIAEMKVVPDFRAPDLIRFGCVPLYTRFEELWEAVQRTRRCVEERHFERYPSTPTGVT